MTQLDASTLTHLWNAVQAARDDVRAARRCQGIDQIQLVTAQRRLLAALEDYVAALRAADVSPRHHVVAEMELLRGVTALDKPRYRYGR